MSSCLFNFKKNQVDELHELIGLPDELSMTRIEQHHDHEILLR